MERPVEGPPAPYDLQQRLSPINEAFLEVVSGRRCPRELSKAEVQFGFEEVFVEVLADED